MAEKKPVRINKITELVNSQKDKCLMKTGQNLNKQYYKKRILETVEFYCKIMQSLTRSKTMYVREHWLEIIEWSDFQRKNGHSVGCAKLCQNL